MFQAFVNVKFKGTVGFDGNTTEELSKNWGKIRDGFQEEMGPDFGSRSISKIKIYLNGQMVGEMTYNGTVKFTPAVQQKLAAFALKQA